MAAVLWLLLNFRLRPELWPVRVRLRAGLWIPQAQADSGSCPDGIAGAANDTSWSADRIASIAGPKLPVMTASQLDDQSVPRGARLSRAVLRSLGDRCRWRG